MVSSDSSDSSDITFEGGAAMPDQRTPYLCGGVFLTQLMQARKPRAGVREHYAGDSDGLSDPETMLAFIKVMSPDFTAPVGQTFKENHLHIRIAGRQQYLFTISVDSGRCELLMIVFVRLRYGIDALGVVTDDFLEVGTSAKKDEYLVKALVEIIRNDKDIPADTMFYINEDGLPSTKKQLLTITAVCFQAFLVGVWHYIIMNRQDNTLGRSTIIDWTPMYSETHIEQVYSHLPRIQRRNRRAFSSKMKPHRRTKQKTSMSSSGDVEPHFGQTGQAPKATKQVIMNNYGKAFRSEELKGKLTININ
jgi:uncharacterized protein (UPF0216 family)